MIAKSIVKFILATAVAAFVAAPAAFADTKERVVIQVSDDNPKTWGQALNVVRNIQKAYGKEKVDVELVAFGLGIGILKADSVMANRIDDTVATGAKVYACENTMRGFKLSKDEMNPKIGYVPAGIIEIIEKQKAGWSVVRPLRKR